MIYYLIYVTNYILFYLNSGILLRFDKILQLSFNIIIIIFYKRYDNIVNERLLYFSLLMYYVVYLLHL